jgi:hypothetical protein
VRVLITGGGSSGSWQIRGVQLGQALGANVWPVATSAEGFDVAVLVKRYQHDVVQAIHRAGVPLVWDIVDAWPQPRGNDWTRTDCLAWLRQQVAAIRPAAIVAPTLAMAADCAQFNVPVLALPHHARPGQPINPVRDHVRTVGYEGGEAYLGHWRLALEAQCLQRGWRFVCNPPALADLDIVVALRASTGYAPRHWKSNVKLANAQATGTPFIGSPEAGYLEQACGPERFVQTSEELASAFDALAPLVERRRTAERMRAVTWQLDAPPQLPGVADIYREWLLQVCTPAVKC